MEILCSCMIIQEFPLDPREFGPKCKGILGRITTAYLSTIIPLIVLPDHGAQLRRKGQGQERVSRPTTTLHHECSRTQSSSNYTQLCNISLRSRSSFSSKLILEVKPRTDKLFLGKLVSSLSRVYNHRQWYDEQVF